MRLTMKELERLITEVKDVPIGLDRPDIEALGLWPAAAPGEDSKIVQLAERLGCVCSGPYWGGGEAPDYFLFSLPKPPPLPWGNKVMFTPIAAAEAKRPALEAWLRERQIPFQVTCHRDVDLLEFAFSDLTDAMRFEDVHGGAGATRWQLEQFMSDPAGWPDWFRRKAQL